MGIFRPQKYIFMSIKLFTIFSIKCYEESHKINEWKFSCDTTTVIRRSLGYIGHQCIMMSGFCPANEIHYDLDLT